MCADVCLLPGKGGSDRMSSQRMQPELPLHLCCGQKSVLVMCTVGCFMVFLCLRVRVGAVNVVQAQSVPPCMCKV